MRLNRYLAQCGLGSRRSCEQLINTGQVQINGQTVSELSHILKPDDQVTVAGQHVQPLTMTYIVMNKPSGYITTMREQFGRRYVAQIVKHIPGIKPVGRLDRNTEGVLLLTNDGELAYRLTHPRFQVSRIYRVTVTGNLPVDFADLVKRGIPIAENQIARGRVIKRRYSPGGEVITIELKEGKNREIRRLFDALNCHVSNLIRLEFAGIRLGTLPSGAWRPLTENEIVRLQKTVGLSNERK